MKDNDDIEASVLNAIIANTTTKIVFAVREPADAEYLARVLFTGFIDYAEWKSGSERPVVVGHRKELAQNRSRGCSEAEHHATGETESVTRGTARTHSRTVAEADGESFTDGTSQATALGSTETEAFGSAVSSFDGASFNQGLDIDTMNYLFTPPTVTSAAIGSSAGSGLSESASASFGSSRADITGSSHAHARSHVRIESEGVADTESEARGIARSRLRGHSKATNETAGESETFVPVLEWLPSQTFTSAEQIERLAGEIMNLANREVFVKVGNQRPVRTRTADLLPAFKSDYCRRLFLPVVQKALAARSPYLHPTAEVDALIAQRSPPMPRVPEPDLAPEPLPIVDDPARFAESFWQKRKKPPARPRLTVVKREDGDKPK